MQSDSLSTSSVGQWLDNRPVGPFQLLIVVLCGLMTALDGFNAQAIGYVAPSISRDWHLRPGDLGPAISIGLVALMAGALFIAPLADRIGRRLILICSALLFGLGTFATAWAGNLHTLMWLRIVTGLGLGGAMPTSLALTSEFMPGRHRAFLLVMMFNGFNIGSMVGGILSVHFLRTADWRAVFLIGGLLPMLLAPVLLLLPESVNHLLRSGGARAKARLVRQLRRLGMSQQLTNAPLPHVAAVPSGAAPRVSVRELFAPGYGATTCLLWVIFFMSLLDIYLLVSWIPTALNVAGAAPAAAITAAILLQAGATVASLPVGWSLDRFGPAATLGVAYLLGTICIAAVGQLTHAVPWALAMTFGAGLGLIGGQAGANAVATVAYPVYLQSTGAGWALGIGRIGSIIGPVVGGAMLNAHVSIPYIFYLSAVPALLAAVATIFLQRRRSGTRTAQLAL
ncbi:MAG TPA: MFS transporter [Steroidobacteraceae bacterium]|nr:MFS transporter [Steroidobacteraceae bacterium]